MFELCLFNGVYQIAHLTGMFLFSNFLKGYQIERVVMEPLCICFASPNGIHYLQEYFRLCD